MSLIEGLFDVSGKTVVVTGGSRGIGYMIARGFVEGGATVVISARKAEACDEAARELSEFGTCISHPAAFRCSASLAETIRLADGRSLLARATSSGHSRLCS